MRPLTPLAKHRMAKGLQQKDLAVLMRVKPSTVSRWERGEFRPEPERIGTLAMHLGVAPLVVADLVSSYPAAATA